MSRATRAVSLACGVIAAVAASAASAQGRETMWTGVVGNGTSIYLDWNRRHPWDTLLTQGTELVASYPGPEGCMLSEAISRGELVDERSLRFALPGALRNSPAGPVCLSFRVSNGRGLPVREAGPADGDTVGFRYAPWEQPMLQRTEVLVAERRLRDAEAAVVIARQNAEQQRSLLLDRGWRDIATCDALSPPRRDARERPYDVVDVSDHDRVARLVCVRQIAQARNLFFDNAERIGQTLAAVPSAERSSRREQSREALSKPFALAGLMPEAAEMLERLAAERGSEDAFIRARRPQAQAFARDWSALSPDIAAYRPHLGDQRSLLAWSTTAADAAFRALGPAVAEQYGAGWVASGMARSDGEIRAAFIGAALDTYLGCLEDSVKQLAIKLEAWQREVESAPAFAVAARNFMVRECRNAVDLAENLDAELASWETELAAASALARNVEGRALPTEGVAARDRDLNFAFCAAP